MSTTATNLMEKQVDNTQIISRIPSTISSLTSLPKQTFAEKLGSDLADRLLEGFESSKASFNLAERLKALRLLKSSAVMGSRNGSSSTDDRPNMILALCLPEPMPNDDAEHIHISNCAKGTFDLNDLAALTALKNLISRYSRVSHMGILDKSYTFFITKDRHAALYYKVRNRVAVVGGGPLCPPSLFPQILFEFEKFRKEANLGISFLGAGQEFVEYCKTQKWTTMRFAKERVLNPMTNPIIHGTAGKSIKRSNRTLLDPRKVGFSLEVYSPVLGQNFQLQQLLIDIYEKWCENRNGSGKLQAYITVYDPFSLPDIMTYIWCKDKSGTPVGFAALRRLGPFDGYHFDPCVALPDSPKGVTDLLLYGAMALLNVAEISYLSLGYEPLDSLDHIVGMPIVLAEISKRLHHHIFEGLDVAGKKAYHDKFHPDQAQQSDLYLVFPPGRPRWRHMSAITHVANISLRRVAFRKIKQKIVGEDEPKVPDDSKSLSSVSSTSFSPNETV